MREGGRKRRRRKERTDTTWIQYMYLRSELKEIALPKNKVIIT